MKVKKNKKKNEETIQNWIILNEGTIELSKLDVHRQETSAAALLAQAFREAGYGPRKKPR